MSGAANESPTVAQELLALGVPADVASGSDGRTPPAPSATRRWFDCY